MAARVGGLGPHRDDLIAAIVRGLSPSGLQLLWSGLDELQRLAVAEAL